MNIMNEYKYGVTVMRFDSLFQEIRVEQGGRKRGVGCWREPPGGGGMI